MTNFLTGVAMEKLSYYFAKMLRRCNRAAIRSSNIHKTSKICSGSQINHVNIDRYSYIGNNCFANHASIGAFCSIADNCFIGGAAHPIEFVSTSPVFCKGGNVMKKNFTRKDFKATTETYIGNDVWIGAGATVLAGKTIGNGAIIGSGSVVTKNIGDYEIWAGNPAKFIRKRFPDEIVTELSELKWWEWDDKRIEEMSEYFDSPEKLIETVKKEGVN